MRTLSNLHPEVTRILQIDPVDHIHDRTTLCVALFASSVDEVVFARDTYPLDTTPGQAAKCAMQLHRYPHMLEAAAEDGLFERAATDMLVLARDDHDLGARMMPIFYVLAKESEMLGISPQVCAVLTEYMEYLRNRYGFAILYTDSEKTTLSPAVDVIPA